MKTFILLAAAPVIYTVFAAEIAVYCDSPLNEVNPGLFGSGDEIDEDFVPMPELVPLIGQTGVTMLRMGGIANEYYDWEGNGYNGVRYFDVVDTLIIQQNAQTSIDDFMFICETNQIEPVLSVNFQLNDPEKAARLVEYCNGDQTTPMGQIRAQRGHPEPYEVEYWEIGNEPDISGASLPAGDYTLTLYRHFGIPFDQWHWSDSTFATGEQFAQLANVYADAMREASPIPLQIATISLAGNISWLEEILQTCAGNTDWVDIHYYPAGSWEQTQPDTTDYIEWLSSLDTGPAAFDSWYENMCTLVQIYGGSSIPVCVMEYNALVVYSDPVWWNFVDGLFIADCLGHMAEMGCPMAGSYSIFEGGESDPGTSFGMIRGDTLSIRGTAWVMKLLSENLQGTMVQSSSDASGGGYGLDVHASLRPDGRLCIIVVNKHLTQEFETDVSLYGFASSGYAEVFSIRNDAPMGAPWNGTTGISFDGGLWGTGDTFAMCFPEASVTCILVFPEGSGFPGGCSFPSVSLAPCPAEGTLSAAFDLDGQTMVEAYLYDLSGRLAAVMAREILPRGQSVRQWERGALPDGAYLLRVVFDGDEAAVRKVVFL